MRLHSLRSKLMISVSALVIGSGVVISFIETRRFSNSLHEAAAKQGEYISRAVALEATNKVLINDLVSLQNLLNYQLDSNPSITYLFVIKDDQILAHTFADGIPKKLIGVNTTTENERGNFKRIVNDEGEHYLDIAWPIFAGKAGVLRMGLSEKTYRSRVINLWLQMTAVTCGILFLSLSVSYLFIKRITRPLSALAEAAENIDEKNLEFNLQPGGHDEVGSLTASFNRMLGRIQSHTQRIEKNAVELDRAYHQTRSSFDIIQKIGAQSSLKDVSSYLILKFREIVSCSELVLLIFSRDRKTLFAIYDHEFKIIKSDTFQEVLSIFKDMDGHCCPK